MNIKVSMVTTKQGRTYWFIEGTDKNFMRLATIESLRWNLKWTFGLTSAEIRAVEAILNEGEKAILQAS